MDDLPFSVDLEIVWEIVAIGRAGRTSSEAFRRRRTSARSRSAYEGVSDFEDRFPAWSTRALTLSPTAYISG